MEVGFHFRTFGNLETHTDEHVLKVVAGLGDEMQSPGAGRFPFGEVKALGLDAGLSLLGGELASACGDEVLDALARLVDGLPGCTPVVLFERPEFPFRLDEQRPPTGQFDVEGVECIKVAGTCDEVGGGRHECVESLGEGQIGHGRSG